MDFGLLAALLIVVLALNLSTSLRFPVPFVDEGWNASRSWGLLHTGRAFGTLDAGVFEKYDGYWTYFPWLAAALHALSVAVFGPSLFAMRFVSALFGTVLLIACYAIARSLYGYRAGLLAAALLAVSFPFVFSSHLARHDIVAAAVGFGAIALYITGGSRQSKAKKGRLWTLDFGLWTSLLAGLLAGLTLDIHWNGLIYIATVGALCVLDHKRALLVSKRFWGFSAGAAAAIAYFAAMHVLPYPQTFSALARLGNGSGHTPPILDLGAWLQSLANTATMLNTMLGLPLVILALAACVVLLRRRSDADKKVLVLAASLVLAFVSIVLSKPLHYSIFVAPAAVLLVAALLDKLLAEGLNRSLWLYARTIVVGGLVAGAAASSLGALRGDAAGDFQITLDGIRQAVPAGTRVIGSQTYWFALPGQEYLSWEQLVFFRRYTPGAGLADAFRQFRSDYFVRDEWIDYFLTDDPARLARSDSDSVLPRAEMDSFLAKNARLVADIKTDTFGSVRLYKITWDRAGGTAP